jgi:L-2-hydroxyglutarate oxidase LhgO
MSKHEIFDYLIVGAGILGAATANYLQERQPNKKIVLIDKYPGWGKEILEKVMLVIEMFLIQN